VRRILFLTESFHPVLGGGETHIRRLGAALVAAGDAVTVVTRRGEPAWPRCERLDDGIRVVRVAPTGPGRIGKYLMVPAASRAVAREAARHDVLVVRGTRVLGLPGLMTGRYCGLATVLQPEINGELDGTAFTWGRPWSDGVAGRLLRAGVVALRNPLLRDADRFVAMSRLIREEMVAAGVEAARVALIPHGVDTLRFRPATGEQRAALRAQLGLGAGVVAVYTGRLLRGKGLELLLEVFAEVAPEHPELCLLMVGSGEGQSLSIEAELRQRVSDRGLGARVLFAGRSDRVEDWLRAADLFVFPSLYEALGISLVEAAACGLPAIGSCTGGIVDVIEDGGSGLLVPPGDAAALAGALRALVTDTGRRQALGARARSLALARFDERDSLARYRTLFAEISPRRPPVSPPAGAPRAGATPSSSPGAPG
jgi:glycosyltransferase involved in cell wall biosynthesis